MNKNAINLLTANQDKIDWSYLSTNPNAISLLTANQDKIVWQMLSANPNAIDLLTANQDKIYWRYLSNNENAIDLLKANQTKIDWHYLSKNLSIFTYDYTAMKENYKELKEEIIAAALHPTRINNLIQKFDIQLGNLDKLI
jgi:hypothetical protein